VSELKPQPCQHCGGETVRYIYTKLIGWEYGYHSIRCYLCKASGPICDTEEDAIREWNRITLKREGSRDEWPKLAEL